MYCDGCGATIHAGMQFCQRCGKRIVGATGAPVARMSPSGADVSRVRRNIQLLAVLWMAYGALRLVSLAWLAVFGRIILPSIFGAAHWGNWSYGWEAANWWFPVGFWFGGVPIFVFGAAYLVLGWALHERKAWARVFGLVLGFLVLLRIPFGTALGIYTIWVLLPEDSRQEYEAMARG